MNEPSRKPVERGGRPPQKRRPRLTGEARERMRTAIAPAYKAGDTIRGLAALHDLSYGLTRALLLEAGVTLRTRRGRRDAGKAAGR